MADGDVEETLAALHAWCVANGEWVSPDGRCWASTAAKILGCSEHTLANGRANGRALRFPRIGKGRVSYALSDIAVLVASGWSDPG